VASEGNARALADTELTAWVAEHRGGPARFDVIEARAQARARAVTRGRSPAVARVADFEIPRRDGSFAVRLYEPASAGRRLIVYLHGGMWMLGDLETHDRTCRLLAAETRSRLLAVDFRRAPEHQWPAAVDDAELAVAWARTELGADAPILAGDSSGGHLALLLALRLRARARPCGGLLLACPNTDLRLTSATMLSLGHGWGLDADSLRWAVAEWLGPDVDPADPAVTPVLANLRGLPPTVVITADHDPLRDEGDALAEALRTAAVPVMHRRERGMVHGFVQNLDLVSPAAGRAVARWHEDARRLLA